MTGYAAGNEYDASFTYDDDGSRTSKTFNGTTTYYITDSSSGYSQVLKSITGVETTYYVREFDLISRSDGTDAYYYLTDVAGSIRGLTDESGNVTDAYVFDSFGNLTESTGTTENSYGFQGEEQDSTGLIYLRARYMDPETGRFLSMDTYGGSLTDTVSQNRYLFANSNPVKYRDPSGHQTLGEMVTSMAIMTTLSTITNTLIAGFTYSTSVTDYSEFSFFEMFKQMGLAYLGGMIVGKLTVFATFLVFALAHTAIEIILCMAICGILGFFTETIAGDFFSDNETVNQILKYISQGFYWTGIAIGFAGIAGGGNQSLNSAYENSYDPKDTWGNKEYLEDHFNRHGKGVGTTTIEEYTQKAHDFLIDSSNYFVKNDNEGIVRIYDPISQYFGSYNPNGTTRTFFVTKSPNYYTNQPGIPV